jgi:hypothetical protein
MNGMFNGASSFEQVSVHNGKDQAQRLNNNQSFLVPMLLTPSLHAKLR